MTPRIDQNRKCLDCPTMISSMGGKKRCAECADKKMLANSAKQRRKSYNRAAGRCLDCPGPRSGMCCGKAGHTTIADPSAEISKPRSLL